MTGPVLVVDDSDFTRMLLVTAVTSLGFPAHGAADANGAMRLARELAAKELPAMALIDLDLGGGPTGADLARGLRRFLPDLGIAILTSYEDPRLLGNLPGFPAGTYYLTKSHLGDLQILDAVIAECMQDPTAPRAKSAQLDLSDGQLEVMRLVALGHSNAEIAKAAWLSVSAVEKSIHRLAQQLALPETGAANRRVLIAQAYYRYTLSPPQPVTSSEPNEGLR
jgi:DNA-binding NarL/FixJ family response regulator